MSEKIPSPQALSRLAYSRLSNGYLEPERLDALAAGTLITRGEVAEILALGDSLELKAFILQNEVDHITDYDLLEAKVDQLVAQVHGLPPKIAFELVREWGIYARQANAVDATAEFYVALTTTMDETGNDTITDELAAHQEFTSKLGRNAAYNKDLQLPYHRWKYQLQPATINARSMFARILEIAQTQKGRHAQAVNNSDYLQSVIVMMIADRLAERTSEHIGKDIIDLAPITTKDLSYSKALRYTHPLPSGLSQWEERGLRERMFLTDWDQDAFLANSDRMREIVSIVFPDKFMHPLFQAYDKALKQSKKAAASKDDRLEAQLALYTLQKALYAAIKQSFEEATQVLHPKVEIAARNLGWYALTSGNGPKVTTKYWRTMHTLTDRGFIDEDNAPSLAQSVTSLVKVAKAEDIDLTAEKKEIGDRLRNDLAKKAIGNLNALADTILAANNKNHPLEGITDNSNWYISTIYFRTTEKKPSDEHYNGAPRKYAAVHELANYIRTFNAN